MQNDKKSGVSTFVPNSASLEVCHLLPKHFHHKFLLSWITMLVTEIQTKFEGSRNFARQMTVFTCKGNSGPLDSFPIRRIVSDSVPIRWIMSYSFPIHRIRRTPCRTQFLTLVRTSCLMVDPYSHVGSLRTTSRIYVHTHAPFLMYY